MVTIEQIREVLDEHKLLIEIESDPCNCCGASNYIHCAGLWCKDFYASIYGEDSVHEKWTEHIVAAIQEADDSYEEPEDRFANGPYGDEW